MTPYTVLIRTGMDFAPCRQTIPGSRRNMLAVEPEMVGNCYSACIASLLAVPIEAVPHFQWQRNIDEYHAAMELPWHDRRLAREWLRTQGHDLATVERAEADGLDCHYIVTVRSHKGPWNHAVIGHRGAVVFDPSGNDTYTMAEADPDDTSVEVIAEPYDPEPAELIRRWLTQVGAS